MCGRQNAFEPNNEPLCVGGRIFEDDIGNFPQAPINKVVTVPLRPIGEHSDIPKPGLLHSELHITCELIFCLQFHSLAPKIPFDLDDRGSSLNINASAVSHRRFETYFCQVARLKFKGSRQNELANVRLYFCLGPSWVPKHQPVEDFQQAASLIDCSRSKILVRKDG